jgi:hypothetical protein
MTKKTTRRDHDRAVCLCGEGLTPWGVSRTPPHPQSAKHKGAEEHDNADEQQEQQAFGDYTYDA